MWLPIQKVLGILEVLEIWGVLEVLGILGDSKVWGVLRGLGVLEVLGVCWVVPAYLILC